MPRLSVFQTPLGRCWGLSAMTQEGSLKANCSSSAAEAPPSHGCPCISLELILLFLLYGSSVVPSSASQCCVFLGNLDTKIQWAGVFGLLFLVAIVVMMFAILHIVGVLPRFWQPVHSVLLIYYLSKHNF